MGTNYYRIPKSKEMTERYQKLHDRVARLDWINPSLIERNFSDIEDPKDSWSKLNPWDEFTYDMKIHLGKRSSGWKFIWNWNSNKFYNTKEELFKFIRDGRVVNEYGELMDTEEFIEMALEWNEENGWDIETYYKENPERRMSFTSNEKHEEYIDGLRVSTSTDFC
jgi:hypothetical protein